MKSPIYYGSIWYMWKVPFTITVSCIWEKSHLLWQYLVYLKSYLLWLSGMWKVPFMIVHVSEKSFLLWLSGISEKSFLLWLSGISEKSYLIWRYLLYMKSYLLWLTRQNQHSVDDLVADSKTWMLFYGSWFLLFLIPTILLWCF